METHEKPSVKPSLTARLNKFFFGDPQEAGKDINAEHQPAPHRPTLEEAKIVPKTWFEEYPAKK